MFRAILTDVLRRAINTSGVSFAELERATGVKRQSLMRFSRGEQSLRLSNADKLIAYFDVRILFSLARAQTHKKGLSRITAGGNSYAPVNRRPLGWCHTST